MDVMGTAEPAHEREKQQYATVARAQRHAQHAVDRIAPQDSPPLRRARGEVRASSRAGWSAERAPYSALRTGPRARHRARKPTGEDDTATREDGLSHPTAPTLTQQSIAKRPVPAHTSTTMDAASDSAGGSGLVGIWVWLCGGCRQARANLRTSVSLSGVPGGCSRGAPHHPLDQTKLQLSLSELDLSRLALRFNSPRRTRRRTALLPSSRRRCRRRS